MVKYLVIDESNDLYHAWIMWEGNDLEEAKKEARDFDSINKRDGNKCHTILVLAEEWEDGDYNLIDFAE